ncbi:PDZ domain-containing protein [Planctomycetota bacterium]
MKSKRLISIIAITLFLTFNAFGAQLQSSDNTAAIGIQLYSSPLPELISKHLGLEPGHGVVITNIQRDSAAEQAGLEKDDIILGFNRENIYDSESLVSAMQQYEIAEEVPMEIIHLGKRKTLSLKLTAQNPDAQWLYPLEPEYEQFWQPGRLFRMDSRSNNLTEIQRDDLPIDIQTNVEPLFNQGYSAGTSLNGRNFRIRIVGDFENSEDTKIFVTIDDEEYETTVKDINTLPEEYRQLAETSLENAIQNRRLRQYQRLERNRQRNDFLGLLGKITGEEDFPMLPLDYQSYPDDQSDFLERLEEQMLQLQERIKELEESQSRFLENLENQQNN